MRRILLPLCATLFMAACEEGQEFDFDAGLETQELASQCIHYVDVEKEESGDGFTLKTAFNSIEEAIIQTAEQSDESCEIRVQESDDFDQNDLVTLSSLHPTLNLNYGDFQSESTHIPGKSDALSNSNSRISDTSGFATFRGGQNYGLLVPETANLGGDRHEQIYIPTPQPQCTSSCAVFQYGGGLISDSFYTNESSIGHGTSGSGRVLYVKGRSDFFSGYNNNQLRMGRDSAQHFQFYVNDANGYIDYEQDIDGDAAHHLYIRNNAGGDGENDIRLYTSGSNRLTIADNGHVTVHGLLLASNIGAWGDPVNAGYFGLLSAPEIYANEIVSGDIKATDKLAAKHITAEEIVLSLDWADNWPDYVFKSDYELMSLDDVENYISENGHLPRIPSAEEVHEKGVSIADNQAALLEKIEELTLHMIEQKKRIDTLEQQLAAQRE